MKFHKDMIWGFLEQLVFSILIIVAFYAIGFAVIGTSGRGITPTDIHKPIDIGGVSSINTKIYNLSITAIVIAFVGSIIPLSSAFYENKKLNCILGWMMVALDIVVLSTSISAVSLWAKDLTIDGIIQYDKSYLAGQFILVIFGTGFALAGNIISYKKYLFNWA